MHGGGWRNISLKKKCLVFFSKSVNKINKSSKMLFQQVQQKIFPSNTYDLSQMFIIDQSRTSLQLK